MKRDSKKVLSILNLDYIRNISDHVFTRHDSAAFEVLRVEPVNFKLKTKIEQQGILESYKFLLKQCDFDFQIYIQTQKIDIKKHVEEIQKCIKFEKEIADMATDYINFLKNITESKSSISRKFYIVYKVNECDSRSLRIAESLKLCGNVVYKCDKKEILKLFNSCFKKQPSNVVALEN